MSKRNISDVPTTAQKRARIIKAFHPIKVASQEAAAAADAETPFSRLKTALDRKFQSPQKGDCIVYWMRMSDLRSNQFDFIFLFKFIFSPFSQP